MWPCPFGWGSLAGAGTDDVHGGQSYLAQEQYFQSQPSSSGEKVLPRRAACWVCQVAPALVSCWPGLTGLWPCAESASWLPHSQVCPPRLPVHCLLCPSFSVLAFPARVPMAREIGVDSGISGVVSGNSVFRLEILYLCSHLIGLPQPWQEISNGCHHPTHTLDLQCPVALFQAPSSSGQGSARGAASPARYLMGVRR